MSTAIETLTAAFGDAFAQLGQSKERDRHVVVTSWPSLPIEIIRASGLRLVVARALTTAAPVADAHLEPGLFPGRVRQLVDAALAGRLADVARVVIPRTSDSDYKCFLYLREFVRGSLAAAMAPTVLFDLLQSDGPHVGRHNAERTRALLDTVGRLVIRICRWLAVLRRLVLVVLLSTGTVLGSVLVYLLRFLL